ncbi:unnamed protein product, partial [Rotaria sp. Silwood2]
MNFGNILLYLIFINIIIIIIIIIIIVCCFIFSKGLQFGNVLTLLQLLDEKNLLREMRFCWINTETNTILSEQISLFRINCVDCLDRTNVVQAAIAKTILEIMLKKLGLLDFDEGGLSGHTKKIFQTMWADNGDAISRQYAGTDAMK